MKLILHVTVDNLKLVEATTLYEKIKFVLAQFPEAHVNGSVVDIFRGSHNEGRPTQEGEI